MAPVATLSGYGARSRDIATALINSDKYDVVIFPTRWGATPQNALESGNAAHQEIWHKMWRGQVAVVSNPQAAIKAVRLACNETIEE